MAERKDSNRTAGSLGDDSPASEEAKQQGMSGDEGAQASRTEGTGSQPAQASNRRPAEHEQSPEQRKSFAPGHAPSEQGDKSSPSPEQIAKHQQGISRQSGSHAGRGDRSEEEAVSGPPAGEHVRHGRHDVSGERD